MCGIVIISSNIYGPQLLIKLAQKEKLGKKGDVPWLIIDIFIFGKYIWKT